VQLNPNICSDNNGGAIVAWQDSTNAGWDIKSQKINSNGVIQWANNGVIVSNATDEQSSPKNVSDGKGGSIYAWQDKRNGINDIYAHHLFSSGSPNKINEVLPIKDLLISPNPCTSNLYLKYSKLNDDYLTIEIIDITGKQIATYKPGKQQHVECIIDVSLLTNGMYFLSIKNENSIHSTSKFSVLRK
jgi:hypothetical protein